MQRREKVALTTVTGQRSTLSIKYQRQVQTGSIHAFAKIGPVLWGKLPKYTRTPHLLLPSFKSCIKKLLNPISSLSIWTVTCVLLILYITMVTSTKSVLSIWLIPLPKLKESNLGLTIPCHHGDSVLMQ